MPQLIAGYGFFIALMKTGYGKNSKFARQENGLDDRFNHRSSRDRTEVEENRIDAQLLSAVPSFARCNSYERCASLGWRLAPYISSIKNASIVLLLKRYRTVFRLIKGSQVE